MDLSKIGCCIYKITSPSSKVYIGQSRNIKRRFNEYKGYNCKNQSILYKSLLKYGWESHTFEIIEECEFEQLNIRERYWQDFYDVLNRGLNCVLKETDELPQKMSDKTKKKIGDKNRGKVRTEEQKELLRGDREHLRGTNHHSFGKTLTDEQKKLISDTKKAQNLKHTEDFKNFLSDSFGTKVIDLSTNTIYNSITKASKATGIKYNVLQKNLLPDSENLTNFILLSEWDRDKEYEIKENVFKNKKSYKVVNIVDGRVFKSIAEAHRTTDYALYSFRLMLLGEKENTTNFKIINI
jgi:group I intron endonuclease